MRKRIPAMLIIAASGLVILTLVFMPGLHLVLLAAATGTQMDMTRVVMA